MGSFYGGGAIMGGSIGGGGTTNYDALQNVPVKNLTGSNEKPIIISDLDTGIYKASGVFKYDNNNEINSFETPVEIIVTTDKATGEKVSIFEYVENGILKAQIATFTDPIDVKDIVLTGSECNCNNFWEQI